MLSNSTHLSRILLAVLVLILAGITAGFAHAQDDTGDSVIAELPDGTVVVKQPDDTVLVELANGLTVALYTNNQVTISGTRVPLEESRITLRQTEMSDGTVITPQEDGTVSINLPDGSVVAISPENEIDIEESGEAEEKEDTETEEDDEDALCTFTAARYINLRAGPSTNYQIVGVLAAEESVDVTGQETGADGYIWWEIGDAWVRSDLGESDCPAVCGNQVCESGEDNSSCAQDCPAAEPTATAAPTQAPASSEASDSTGSTTCVVSDCDACYRTISCYPECNQCSCSQNAYGCPTCYCTTPASTEESTRNACDFSSCEACIAAFPCNPGPCGTTTCTLNEYGCPTCTTGP